MNFEDLPVLLEGELLTRAVAGVLLIHSALRSEEPVYVQRELEEHGIVTTTHDVARAVDSCRRRGMAIDAVPRQTGYWLRDWLRPAVVWAGRAGKADKMGVQ
jgi:hypothetical protein